MIRYITKDLLHKNINNYDGIIYFTESLLLKKGDVRVIESNNRDFIIVKYNKNGKYKDLFKIIKYNEYKNILIYDLKNILISDLENIDISNIDILTKN